MPSHPGCVGTLCLISSQQGPPAFWPRRLTTILKSISSSCQRKSFRSWKSDIFSLFYPPPSARFAMKREEEGLAVLASGHKRPKGSRKQNGRGFSESLLVHWCHDPTLLQFPGCPEKQRQSLGCPGCSTGLVGHPPLLYEAPLTTLWGLSGTSSCSLGF